MGTIVLDTASKLEVVRRGLADLIVNVKPIRNLLQQDSSADQNEATFEAREALGRIERSLTEMKEAIDAQGT